MKQSKNSKMNRALRSQEVIFLALMLISFVPLSFALSVEELDQRIKDRETTYYREFFDNIF